MGWLAAGLLALPALAQTERLAERIALDAASPTVSVSENQTEPLATAGAAAALGARSGASQTARQTMVWMQTSRQPLLGVGIGVEQRGAYRRDLGNPLSAAVQPAGVLLGLSLETGARSRLTLQTPLLNAPRPPLDDLLALPQQDDAARQLRMGLVFDTSNSAYADLRRGVRVELSGQTTLSFKPRSGRLGVTLQSRW